jgi:hypothetical protein
MFSHAQRERRGRHPQDGQTYPARDRIKQVWFHQEGTTFSIWLTTKARRLIYVNHEGATDTKTPQNGSPS